MKFDTDIDPEILMQHLLAPSRGKGKQPMLDEDGKVVAFEIYDGLAADITAQWPVGSFSPPKKLTYVYISGKMALATTEAKVVRKRLNNKLVSLYEQCFTCIERIQS